ncbi:MAG: sugar transferase [Clostridia bacterium]|nr:sugar transferase [Clostridia bacterium]
MHVKKGKDGFYNRYVKRILDFLLALNAFLVLSPLFLALTVVGAVAMKGNPFFIQPRPGKTDPETGSEKVFYLIKFRTMSNKRGEDGNLLPDEQRMNRYGRFLRRTSLDELGELLNIIKGDMAVIGPRPWLCRYLPYYSDYERRRHLVRPGLTGLSQVSGRNALTWEMRFGKDIEYVENVSFLLDVKIFFKTVTKVFAREGIEFRNTETIFDYFESDHRVKEKETVDQV